MAERLRRVKSMFFRRKRRSEPVVISPQSHEGADSRNSRDGPIPVPDVDRSEQYYKQRLIEIRRQTRNTMNLSTTMRNSGATVTKKTPLHPRKSEPSHFPRYAAGRPVRENSKREDLLGQSSDCDSDGSTKHFDDEHESHEAPEKQRDNEPTRERQPLVRIPVSQIPEIDTEPYAVDGKAKMATYSVAKFTLSVGADLGVTQRGKLMVSCRRGSDASRWVDCLAGIVKSNKLLLAAETEVEVFEISIQPSTKTKLQGTSTVNDMSVEVFKIITGKDELVVAANDQSDRREWISHITSSVNLLSAVRK